MQKNPNARLLVQAGGRTWTIERKADMETLWAGMDDSRPNAEDHIPYWAELWPASILLARHMMKNSSLLKGKRCLDVGCGLGLTAVVASHCGAKVIAFDREYEPLPDAARNAEINSVPQPQWLCLDWNHPCFKGKTFDCIWGGDIVYEKRFFDPLERLFSHALAPGGRIWLGEPVRTVSKTAWDRFRELGWVAEKLTTESVPNQGAAVTVNLWELSRP